jgi:hypothetical protein
MKFTSLRLSSHHMTRQLNNLVALTALMVALLAFPGVADAHERWFYDAAPNQTRGYEAFEFPQILFVAAAIALTVVAGALWRWRRGRDFIPGPQALGATESGRARF